MAKKVPSYAGFNIRFQIALEEAGLHGTDAKGKKVGQEPAAKALGVTVHTVGKLLKGQRLPSEDLKFKICAVTGVCMEWLMMNRGPKRVEDVLDLTRLPPDSRKTVRDIFNQLEVKTKG